jgi:hypothetical protein
MRDLNPLSRSLSLSPPPDLRDLQIDGTLHVNSFVLGPAVINTHSKTDSDTARTILTRLHCLTAVCAIPSA